MPSALEYVKPTDPDRSRFNTAVHAEYTERKDVYVTALNYYMNKADSPFTAREDDPDYDPKDDNTLVNLVKMAAQRTTSFLFPALPDVQIDRDSIEPTDEEKWIKEQFIPANGGLPFFIKWALRGFLAGHSFIWMKNQKPVPRMVLLHPLAVTVFWQADDTNEVLWYEQRYVVQDELFIRDFVKKDDGKWEIILYRSTPEKKTRVDKIWDQFSVHGDTDAMYNLDTVAYGNTFRLVRKDAHPGTIPPILETAHLPAPDSYYGEGEFTNKDLLDTINKVASLRTRIIRLNAEPTDVITGADLDDIEDGDGIVAIPSAGAKVTRLSLSSDLMAVTSTLEHLIELFLGEMRVVILKGEAKDLQRVTNAAVRTLFLDALAKNSVLWAAYGYTTERIFRLALLMAYGNGVIKGNPSDKPIKLTMASPLPTDFSEIANINALAIAGQYRSRRTASVAIGDDPIVEQALMELEHTQDIERQTEQMELAQAMNPEEDQPDNNEERE